MERELFILCGVLREVTLVFIGVLSLSLFQMLLLRRVQGGVNRSSRRAPLRFAHRSTLV